MEIKNIVIIGSTGSIGTQTLDVIRGREDFNVIGLSCNESIATLEKQIEEFKPKYVCVSTEEQIKSLKEKFPQLKFFCGLEGLTELATVPESNFVIVSIVGMRGIKPTIEAIKAKKDIALANKETLVCAGHIIMPLIKEYKVNLYPIDSEHSAIWQCLQGEDYKFIDKIWLTCSGGPFRKTPKEDLKHVTLEDALKHPSWSMGKKITIDSSTLVNKGLEILEAKWLFNVDVDNINVLIQPKSLIHSMVQFKDGSVKAQLGPSDMRIPIEYALFRGTRISLDYLENFNPLDFYELGNMEFEKPRFEDFPALNLAKKAGRALGSLPTVYNASNEEAVNLFINKKISYLSICDLIEKAMNRHKLITNPTYNEILEVEKEARDFVKEESEKLK